MKDNIKYLQFEIIVGLSAHTTLTNFFLTVHCSLRKHLHYVRITDCGGQMKTAKYFQWQCPSLEINIYTSRICKMQQKVQVYFKMRYFLYNALIRAITMYLVRTSLIDQRNNLFKLNEICIILLLILYKFQTR